MLILYYIPMLKNQEKAETQKASHGRSGKDQEQRYITREEG